MKTAAEQALADAFAAAKAKLPGDRKVAALREAAFGRFDALGLPHRRVEEWKYTDLRALMRDAKPLAGPPDAAAKARAKDAGALIGDIDARRIVFVDGAFVPELSDLADLAPGLTIRSMAQALAAGDRAGRGHLGKVVPAERRGRGRAQHRVDGRRRGDPRRQGRDGRAADPSGVRRDRRQAGRGVHPLAGRGRAGRARHAGREPRGPAAATIRSTPRSNSWSATTPMSITSRSPARRERRAARLDADGRDRRAMRASTTSPSTSAAAWCATSSSCASTARARVAGMRGASLLKGKQHVDTTLVVDHKAGGCQSREVFKSVLDDESRGVFQGKIVVRPHAQKTDAKMMTQALLLSDEAEADNKPELEIFADDVQCGHGATAGALDEDLKFYLMARGIPRSRGRGAADPGLRRRGDRGHRACRPARGADGAGRRPGCRRGELTHASRGEQRRLRRRPHPRGFPDPRRCRSTASRWSISTTPPRRRSRRRCSTASSRPTRREYANVHRGLHYLANAATEAYEGAREKVRGLPQRRAVRKRSSSPATPPRRSTSSPIRSARERIKPGDEIVLSIMEHHSNIVPWHFLRERQGAVIKWAPVDDEGNFLIDEFEKLLTPRTKMVAITHMSNMLGTLVPVKEVVRLAHARGIPVLVDGARRAVHLDVDVQDIDCDFYAFTGHKLYGPTGIGVLYGKYEHLAAMPPFNGGGEMIREVFEDRVTYGEPPHRSRPARRRSCRRSGSAPRSTTSTRSARRASAPTRTASRALCARAAARDQLAAHLRHAPRTRARSSRSR